MTRTISQIIDEWEQGMITTHEVYPALLALALEAPLDEIVVEVPEPWRARFVNWLREAYGNETPEANFVWLDSATLEPAGARRVIALARDWLGRQAPRPPEC